MAVRVHYKHIGYFNEIPDLRFLADKDGDATIEYYSKGYGRFYEDDANERESDLCPLDEVDNIIDGVVYFTKDRKYAIYNGTKGWDWVEKYADAEDGDCSDAFIDLYERVEDVTYEVCPHCGEEVELENELKVQECPNCGKHIVTCSMCVAVNKWELENVCKNCPLIILADEMNKG